MPAARPEQGRFLQALWRFTLLVLSAWLLLSWLLQQIPPLALPRLWLALLLWAGLTVLPGRVLGLPGVWQVAALLLYPMLLLMQWWQGSPWWFLLAGAVLFLLLGAAWRGRVPLFLSASPVLEAIPDLMPRSEAPLRIAELGCGTGRVVAAMVQRWPQHHYVAVEVAWLPWLMSRWRLRHYPQVRVLREDFWRMDWQAFDVLYVFLSPLVMPAVWQKAQAELRPGSWLISNSFAIPGQAPDLQRETGHALQPVLYGWQQSQRAAAVPE
ncbi:class I SAM-dependent methyltransferase [Leeia aquatica]|uniref:Class I SAM-dependent methyltransferase n=1 Tax=Leeia aquatica TaxID=2725557 RepID=A0A847RY62_9NEIS|nr:class I SAM-dependent methyltransferase [Leeia aquatica]NLR74661.1 class I SAM-dependent methyltransferase [Leeia aquatica]